MEKIEVVIAAREKDLGDLIVRRILPYEHCMIGPFIFYCTTTRRRGNEQNDY